MLNQWIVKTVYYGIKIEEIMKENRDIIKICDNCIVINYKERRKLYGELVNSTTLLITNEKGVKISKELKRLFWTFLIIMILIIMFLISSIGGKFNNNFEQTFLVILSFYFLYYTYHLCFYYRLLGILKKHPALRAFTLEL